MKTFLVCLVCFCIWEVGPAQRIDLPSDSVSFAIKKLDYYLKNFGKDTSNSQTEPDFITEQLPEVLLYKNNKINAVALGIIP